MNPGAADGSRSPETLPSWRDPGLLLVLLGTAALQFFAWSRLEGYQLADSVEYMDRAWAVARGEALDPSTIRSFAFSALLLPIFAVAEWLGLDDLRPVVAAVRLSQMALGWLAVALVARAGARLWGHATGLACGALLGLNPLFAQYTITPLSATVTLLSMAFVIASLAATDRAEHATFKRGLVTGSGLGIALLMAFKTIPVIGLVVLALPLNRSWRRRPHLFGVLVAFGAMLFAQALLDWYFYGTFGSSLRAYLLVTAAPMVASILYKLGQVDIAVQLYEAMPGSEYSEGGEFRTKFPRDWYLTELTSRALVWPAAILAAIGAVRSAISRRWLPLLVLTVFLVNLGLLSVRGHKTFRLWMPLLPFLALIAGAGWDWLFVSSRAARSQAHALAGGVILFVVGGLGAIVVSERNLAKYGGYWRAMDLLAETADGSDTDWRVASAYDWAARFRERPGLELIKLPAHLDQWAKLDEDRREAILDTLSELDGFIGHLQVIVQDPRILRVVNERFELVDVIDDRATMEELEPIYVLRRRTGNARARTFYELYTDAIADEDGPGDPTFLGRYQAAIEHPRSVDFRRRMPDGSVRQMVLLGIDVEPGLADGNQAWLTYHWYAGPLGGADYTIVDRLTDRDGGGYNNNHRPAHGALPTSEWIEGSVIRESFLTRLGPEPADFGGSWRRGDRLPVELWMGIAEYDEQQQQVGGLVPFHASGAAPIHRERSGAGFRSNDGRRWSNDALMLVGGFWLPTGDQRRVPDDGRPIDAER